MRTPARLLYLPLTILGCLLLLRALFVDGRWPTAVAGVVALLAALMLYKTNGAPRVLLGMTIWAIVVLVFLVARWLGHDTL